MAVLSSPQAAGGGASAAVDPTPILCIRRRSACKDREVLTWEQTIQRLKADPAQQELVRACYYDDPLLDAAKRFEASAEWTATMALLGSRRGRVLELGAGRGIASFALARAGWRVTALEPDPSDEIGAGAISNLANQAALPIEVVRGHGEDLPFPEERFDLVYGRAVLHHAADLRRLCREVGRVLKPRGRLLAVREHVLSRASDLPQFLRSHPLHHYYGGEHAFLMKEYVGAIRGGKLELLRRLNPWASLINLHPSSPGDVRMQIAHALHIPKQLIPVSLLPLLGTQLRTPGRLYSFLAEKR